ncbi:hypothetical protein Tco_0851830, partial [Tanacetum coccineum]
RCKTSCRDGDDVCGCDMVVMVVMRYGGGEWEWCGDGGVGVVRVASIWRRWCWYGKGGGGVERVSAAGGRKLAREG